MLTRQIRKIKSEHAKLRQDYFKKVTEISSKDEILQNWYFRNQLTDHRIKQIKRGELTLTESKKLLKQRFKAKLKRQLEKDIERFTEIINAGTLIEATISIEYRKNRTWGWNPSAEAEVWSYKNGERQYETFRSGSIGGAGYDKESTAFARALNQSLVVTKLLLTNTKKIGKTYGFRDAQISEGVGVGCYYEIFEKAGYRLNRHASGKTFDIYTIKKV